MRRPRYIDFRCTGCGFQEEHLVETDDNGEPLERPFHCDNVDWMEVVPNLKIGDVLGRTKYPVEEEVIRA